MHPLPRLLATPSHVLLGLVLVALLAAQPLAAGPVPSPQLTDVSAAAGLDFTLTYGALPGDLAEPSHNTFWLNMGNGVAVGDYDGDGDLDLYLLTQLGNANRLLRNNLETGAKTFTEVTTPPLDDTGMSRIAHFVDLDRDGDLDLVLLNDDHPSTPSSKLFENNGDGSWTDRTPGSGFAPTGYLRGGCAIADYDGDGLLDLYVTVWVAMGLGDTPIFPGQNHLFRNLGDFEFEDVTDSSGLGVMSRDSFSTIFHDFDDDNRQDLFVAVDHTSDEFFWNTTLGFTNASGAVELTHVGNDMGVAAADIDDDDDLDIFASNINDPNFFWGTLPRGNALHINQRTETGTTTFVDEASDRGVLHAYWGWGTQFFDLENDGDLDLVVGNGFDEFVVDIEGPGCAVCFQPVRLFVNDGTANFTPLGGIGLDDPFDTRGLVVFDYDRDGDQDLLITNIDQPMKLFENTTSDVGNQLTVIPYPHHLAPGARAYATFGGMTKRRDHLVGRSYLSGTPGELYFGLGSATVVDTLRVVWPDGGERVLTNVPAGTVREVDHPSVLFRDGFESGDVATWSSSLGGP